MKTLILKETFKGAQAFEIPDEFFAKRVLFFTNEVSPKTAEMLICQLLYLDDAAPNVPITLYINSPGGDVSSGLAICDVIRGLRSPVDTVCIGTAASMGAIVFMEGRNRTMLPHSRLMIHDPSFGNKDITGVKPLNIQDDLDKLMEIRTELAEIMAERTGRSVEEILEKTKTDFTMTAKEAIEFGAATIVGCPPITPEKEIECDE